MPKSWFDKLLDNCHDCPTDIPDDVKNAVLALWTCFHEKFPYTQYLDETESIGCTIKDGQVAFTYPIIRMGSDGCVIEKGEIVLPLDKEAIQKLTGTLSQSQWGFPCPITDGQRSYCASDGNIYGPPKFTQAPFDSFQSGSLTLDLNTQTSGQGDITVKQVCNPSCYPVYLQLDFEGFPQYSLPPTGEEANIEAEYYWGVLGAAIPFQPLHPAQPPAIFGYRDCQVNNTVSPAKELRPTVIKATRFVRLAPYQCVEVQTRVAAINVGAPLDGEFFTQMSVRCTLLRGEL